MNLFKNIYKIILLINLLISCTFAQVINKVEPPNWWVGMKLNKIQLMVYGENLNNISASFNDKSIKVIKVHDIKNSNYAFIDIEIPSTIQQGEYTLTIKKNKKEVDFPFYILNREPIEDRHNGFSNKDAIYLIMPDRFVNADIYNDTIEGIINDYKPYDGMSRFGGDLQGIINKFDYIKELGYTSIWLNPITENNCKMSYHGYASTDLYKIDPRLGTNLLYKTLVEEAHKKDLKIIFDHIANHISINHPWIKNLPTEDWLNGTPKNYFITSHNKKAFSDLHSSKESIHRNEDGWFTPEMPDLNQRNPYVANYLIQNMIWWIEYSGLDGIREDTYPYADQKFMARWNKTILDEYPKTNIVGEAWESDPVNTAFYQKDSYLNKEFNSNLPSVMDFALMDKFQKYLSGEASIFSIYESIAKDFVYPSPNNLFTFIDNHDYQRGIFSAKGNIAKFKTAVAILLTSRGIPQVLYASELGIQGGKSHSELRFHFPGGMPDDKRDAFTKEGRTEEENDLYNFYKKLLTLRKEYPALSQGKMTHFPPVDNVYYYFKEMNSEKFFVVINGEDKEKQFDLKLVEDKIKGVKSFNNVLNDETLTPQNAKIQLKEFDIKIYKVI
ncbi:MAG TPA: alpha-amylase family glycosyl hydrolase [Ignavibacteriaceae bacterium]|nr:alpha-amylase family glycosyl hydrolase [Ignavibacteriaceae bacterium]